MKFLCTVFIFAALQYELITEVQGFSDGKNCSEIVSYRESRRVPYLETYKQKTWGFFYKTQVRWNYRTEYYTAWRKEYICCEGYKLSPTRIYDRCEPICEPPCRDGLCIRPNECMCYYGYTKAEIVFDRVCVPVCSPNCIHGKCTRPNTCTCNSGYSLNNDKYTCDPICNPACTKEAYCSKPNHCECLNGYTNKIHNGQKISNKCEPVCEKKCINGACTAPNTCTCLRGYYPDPDNLFACKPICIPECIHGTCTKPYECTCNEGYKLTTYPSKWYANQSVCEPICSEACVDGTCVAPESCSCFEGYGLLENSKHMCVPVCEKACLNGKCIAPGVCACNEGFRLKGDESTTHICEPYCKISCEPFGVCTAPDVCTCFEGYRLVNKTQAKKIDMQYFADNSVCEPICDTECINGFCVAPNTCNCKIGYHPSSDNAINVCEPICSQNCVNGFCSAPETCTCNKGYRPSKNSSNICEPFCETDCINGYCSAPNECTCNSGYRPTDGNRTSLCEPICNPNCENGICVQPDVCNCNPGYRQSAHSTNVCEPICHPVCETNGICEAPDLCTCKDGYRMIYYDTGDVPFRCEPICSVECGNGTCTAPDLCTCFDDYRNTETGTCEPVCSMCNNGTCVAPEVCECDDGFIHSDVEDSNVEGLDVQVEASRRLRENKPGNTTKCIPYCESCDNGECVAPNECQCHAGFVKIEGTCVQACQDGCGTHGMCNEECKTCECNYGWTGLHCDQPTLCVVIFDYEENSTEPLRFIKEQDATIEDILLYNPTCPECINELDNDTSCFKMHRADSNGTLILVNDEIQISCLINRECLAVRSQYKDQKEIIKLSGIATGVGILLLIVAAITTYVLLRKRRNRQMELGEVRHSTSMQGLIHQSASNS